MNNVPAHIGIIMDGNGRWAKARGKNRSYGHKIGSDNVERIVSYAYNKGVRTLSLYAFSSENWSRPKEEVDELMRLLKKYFNNFIGKVIKNDVRLVVIGGREALSEQLRTVIEDGEKKTENNTLHNLVIAINYGGRQEIVQTVNKLVAEGKEITDNNILSNLSTAEFGEPDLIIRTGGDLRLSNFLLYQGAYSELYFTKVLWPDFDEACLDLAISEFGDRKRRFGKI